MKPFRILAACLLGCCLASAAQAQYCSAGSLRCDSGIDRIRRVTFNSIDHDSGIATGPSGCYTDNTSISTSVYKGNTYSITVYNVSPLSSTTSQAGAWIDWNQDFAFGDINSGEQIALNSSDGNLTYQGTVNVPANAVSGTTRLRVRVMFTGALSPCDYATFGEVEDYTVTVLDPTTGACCDPSGTCSITAPGDCSGAFQGVVTSCAPGNPCGGSCCTSQGTCTVTLASGCPSPNIFVNHAACSPTSCLGVCCDLVSGACTPTGFGASGCICGTTWQGIGSTCSPTPCVRVVCCNNVTGACSLTAVSGCPAGSTAQSAGSVCTPNPCGGACCNPTTGACSVVLNLAGCNSGAGPFTAGGVCTPSHPCLQGACCNTNTSACTMTLAGACVTAPTNSFQGAGTTCQPTTCPATGACCNTATGACTATLAPGCVTAPANNFLGIGTFCSPVPCTTGACCNNTSGACTTGGSACASGLTYQGASTTCTPVPCLRGACCNNTSGACTTATSSANCAAGTTYQGDSTVCSPTPCFTGACCNNTSGACTAVTSTGCASGSTYQGDFVSCSPNPCGQGSCCNNTTGACSITATGGCTSGSTFQGIGGTCGPNPCGTGACCVPSGSCSISDSPTCLGSGGTYMGPSSTCSSGNCFAETESNDTKFTANGPFVLGANDQLVGFSLSSGSPDYFKVQPPAFGPGIYRHVLRCTSTSDVDGTAGHVMVSQGISQIDGVADYHNNQGTEAATGQSSAAGVLGGTPAKSIVWYGFGQSEVLNFLIRWQGTVTPAPYSLALTSAPVTPTDLGTLPGGYMTFTTVGQTTANTDMWLYDSSFQAIPGYGNDDVPNLLNHGTLQSQFTKDILTPGVYYLALCDSVLMIDHAGALPPLERDPNNAVSDPGTALCTSGTVNVNLNFAITDGAGAVHQYTGTKVNGYDILWYKITVGAPATGGCCKPDGSCEIASQLGCTSTTTLNGVVTGGLGGVYGGNGTVCFQACPQPSTGACCQLDGTCVFQPVNLCTSYSGAWHGVGSSCTAIACPGVVSGGGITFDGNASSAQQGGVFVDLTAGPDPITVNRIDLYCGQAYNNAPLAATGAIQNPMEFVIFTRQGGGSYSGFEGGVGNSGCEPPPGSNWIVNTDTGQVLSTPGNWTSTPITLRTPITIPAGATQGLYITSKFGGVGYRIAGDTMFAGSDGVVMETSEGRSFAATSNPGWNSGLLSNQASFNGRIFYSVVGSGVCCRGSTCSASVTQSNCTTSGGTAGANFTTAGSACNAAGTTNTPCCYADYNKVNGVSVQDIFDFLSDWFAGSVYAKVGGDGATGGLSVQDIFNFLGAWFAGGC